MPSSIGYASAISRRTEEACSVSPTPTNSSFGEGSADSKDFREFSIRSWSRDSRSDSAMDRHSESSESLDNHSTSSGHGRHLHDFSTEFIPTRSTKLTAPKPAYNPMQFVKTGPAKLCETARVQMQKAVEVKKVREVKKEEAEDWQANLEGWKSSRRKRQEHVIERVTEVKRIEQEEALRAADAAAKKNKTFTEMMGKRGSRSRLLALYSTDESEESDVVTNGQLEESSQSNGPPAEENKPECRTDAKDALEDTEYTYDKAIADYVKFTSAALSKTPTPLDEEPAEKRPESRTTNSNDNIMETAHVPTVLRRSRKVEQTLANLQAATDSTSGPEKQTTNVSESVEVVAEVSKRRSFFESVASLEAKESEANKLTHRKSGDFSSSFKSRLAAFAGAENAEGNKRSPSPVRDPEFRQKLSAFQGATAESKPETATKSHQRVKQEVSNGFTSQSQLEKTTITTAEEKTIIQNDTFQQATVISQSVTVDQQQATMENFLEETKQQLNESEKQPESHLAPQSNSSGESDFTEDEGIRSLSPRGTDSPGSPVETSQPVTEIIRNFSAFHFSEKETIVTKALPTVEKQPIEFKQKEIPLAKAPPTVEREPIDFVQRETPTNKTPPVYGKQPIAVSLPKVIAAEPQQPAAFTGEVWDASNWLMISDVSNVAPPIEKPPPPPPDDDTDAPTQPDDDVSKSVATESGSLKKIRTELRKRRSDFLGIDVQAENHIFLEEDGEVPPPPDLKSLLREAEFRTSDLRMYADDIVIEDRYVEKYYTDATEEDELARVEREIIENLEKEEMERQKGGNNELDDYLTEGLNNLETSYDEDSAAIRSNMALLDTLAPQASRSKALPKAEETNKDNLMAESVNPAQIFTEKARPPPIPAKPSKLSAAPKPRLHDGESWMAKRKAAVEGPRKEKDVSRHWLIQEAEQRRITELQERSQPPSHWGSMPSVAQPLAPSPANHEWLSRSSSSTSMDKLTQPMASNSLNPSPHLYSNQQEILEYADFTQAPESSGQIWQVRSLNTGSIDHLQKLVKEEKMTLQHSKSVSHLASQKEPAGRSTLPPEIAKEPIAPLPDSVINTLTQRVAQRSANYADYMNIQDALPPKAAPQVPPSRNKHTPLAPSQSAPSLGGVIQSGSYSVSGSANQSQEKLINVSGKKKCSLCNEPLGRGAAMIIESLRLFYHITCFRCCVCGMALGNGTSGTDVRVRNNHLHCHDCYSNDEGLKFSKV